MKNRFPRRPSPSMLVAIVALIFGASGTAVAASGLVSGDRLIQKHSLSGNRLRNNTITRREVNLSKLGTVPSANNANTIAGLLPSSFEPATNTMRTGFVRLQQNTSETLGTFGPFTLTASCVKNGNWDAKISVSSSQEGSEVDGINMSGTTTVADTGPVSSSAEAKKTGVDFASYGTGVHPVAYWGDLMIIAAYGGPQSDSCMASALVTVS